MTASYWPVLEQASVKSINWLRLNFSDWVPAINSCYGNKKAFGKESRSHFVGDVKTILLPCTKKCAPNLIKEDLEILSTCSDRLYIEKDTKHYQDHDWDYALITPLHHLYLPLHHFHKKVSRHHQDAQDHQENATQHLRRSSIYCKQESQVTQGSAVVTSLELHTQQ